MAAGVRVSTVAGVSAVLGASAAGGSWDVGREAGTPEAGLEPKALLKRALARFIVPTFEVP